MDKAKETVLSTLEKDIPYAFVYMGDKGKIVVCTNAPETSFSFLSKVLKEAANSFDKKEVNINFS